MKLWKTDLEDYIEKLYFSINIIHPDKLNIEQIAVRLGIELRYDLFPSKCLLIKGKTYIVLDKRLSAQEQQQDFYHELCHAMLHVGKQRDMPLSFRQFQEWKARSFMEQATIPSFMLEKTIEGIQLESQAVNAIAAVFKVEHKLARKRLDQYLRLKKELFYFHQLQLAIAEQSQ